MTEAATATKKPDQGREAVDSEASFKCAAAMFEACCSFVSCGRIASTEAPISNTNKPRPNFCAFSKIDCLPTPKQGCDRGASRSQRLV